MVNDDGIPVERYDYAAYGVTDRSRRATWDQTDWNTTWDIPCTTATPYLYTGEFTDCATGLQYNRARWYAADVGRFASVDPVVDWPGNFANPFLYAASRPSITTDALGTRSYAMLVVSLAVVGALVGAARHVIVHKRHEGIVAAALWGAAYGATAGLVILAFGGLLAAFSTMTFAAGVEAVIALLASWPVFAIMLAVTISVHAWRLWWDSSPENVRAAVCDVGFVLASRFLAERFARFLVNLIRKPYCGTAFKPGGNVGSVQEGVDPRTLTWQSKNIRNLDPQRMRDVMRAAGDRPVKVTSQGVIRDGHHRVAGHIERGQPIDVEIVN